MKQIGLSKSLQSASGQQKLGGKLVILRKEPAGKESVSAHELHLEAHLQDIKPCYKSEDGKSHVLVKTPSLIKLASGFIQDLVSHGFPEVIVRVSNEFG